jgi:hypothetical protein
LGRESSTQKIESLKHLTFCNPADNVFRPLNNASVGHEDYLGILRLESDSPDQLLFPGPPSLASPEPDWQGPSSNRQLNYGSLLLFVSLPEFFNEKTDVRNAAKESFQAGH